MGLDARQVIIQHVEHLHIHTSAAGGRSRMDRAERITVHLAAGFWN